MINIRTSIHCAIKGSMVYYVETEVAYPCIKHSEIEFIHGDYYIVNGKAMLPMHLFHSQEDAQDYQYQIVQQRISQLNKMLKGLEE